MTNRRSLEHVPANLINDESYRMRESDDDDTFRELVRSIQNVGILVPILLRKQENVFLVVAGHRRYRAASMAGLLSVPAYIFDEAEKLGWSAAFAENMYRKDLTPIEEAAALEDCLMNREFTVDSLAVAIGRTPSWINSRLELLEWPDEVTRAIHLGKLSVSAARNLAGIADSPHRALLLDYAIENGATARTTAAWLQAWRVGQTAVDPGAVQLEEGRTALPPITPYTPCVICGVKHEMAHLTYAPICAGCSEVVVAMAREVRKQGCVADTTVY